MSKYTCEKCGKEFNNKSQHTRHLNNKKPCNVESKIKSVKNANIKDDDTTPIQLKKEKTRIPKPILKWVGGKTQIVDKLISEFPTEIHNYREIFLGGGSVLLALLSCVKNDMIKIHGNIYAYDLNEPLIYVYKNIQSNHDELYNITQTLITEFNSCQEGEINRTPANIDEAKIAKENYYYWIRSEYNKLGCDDKKTAMGSAMFIFLNKTCFRGVFRVGPRGFNVPYGHYNNPEIINKEHLCEICELIQNVIFECCDFNTCLNMIESDDFVYLDPPYNKETDTSFVGYTEHGFDIEKHTQLFNLCNELDNSKFIMSNSNTDFVKQNFPEEKYNIQFITAKRSINSKNPEAKTTELIIKNY
jgi:DNA adenine methylase